MGSPLGPVLAGIFMIHLERALVPKFLDIRILGKGVHHSES